MTIIQHKRGTSERWAELNPVLSEGEIGYDTTVKKAKIGDGVTAWADLPFMVGGGGEPVDAYTKAETDSLLAEKNNKIFDINKFTVVGSPTITDDGIASGFTGINYLKIPNLELENANMWEVEGIVKIISAEGNPEAAWLSVEAGNGFMLPCVLNTTKTNVTFQLYLSSVPDTWDISQDNSIIFPIDCTVKCNLKFTGTQYIYTCTNLNTGEVKKVIKNNTSKVYQSPTRLGTKRNQLGLTYGSINLPAFKITIDGKEVFNGLMDSTKPIYDAIATNKNALTEFKTDTSNNFSAVNSALNEKANLSDLSLKQNTLVSGTNIKTINGVTLLGEGNIDVSGGAGGASIDDATTSSTSVWSSEKVNNEISTVKSDVQNLQTEVVTVQGGIASLDADVSTLNGVVASHTTSISSINDSVAIAQTDILDLKENKQEKIGDSATITISTGSVGGVIPASPYELAGNAVVNSETNELTGTNANSYLKLPEPFRPSENDSWEIQAAFICKSMAGEYILNPIFNEYDTNKSVPQLYCYKEYLAADISFDGSTWGIEEWGANVAEMNCSNSVMNLGRLSYDAPTKTLTLSLSKDDGATWASLTQTVSGQVFSSASSTFIIGADNRTTGHGTITPIYLNKTWIKINGEYWWHPFPIEQGATATTANVKISVKEGNAITQEDDGLFVSSAGGGGGTSYTFTDGIVNNGDVVGLDSNLYSKSLVLDTVGTPTLSDNFIGGGFTTSSYFTSKSFLDGTEDNWEMCIKFDFATAGQDNQGILDSDTRTGQNIRLTITSDNKLSLRINSNLSNNTYALSLTGSTTLSVNTIYYAKIKYSSSTGYEMYLSTNGIDYTLDASSATITKLLYSTTVVWTYGKNVASTVFTGNIYFEDSYIIRNNIERISFVNTFSDYNKSLNKPKINGVVLNDKTTSSTLSLCDRFTPDNPIHFDTVRVSNFNGLTYSEGTLTNTITTLNCLGGTGYVSYGSGTAGAVTFDIDGNCFNSSLYLDIPISQGECLFLIKPPFDTADNAGYQYIFGNKNSNGYLKPIISFGENASGAGQQIGDNCTLGVQDNKYIVVTGNVLSAVTTPALAYDSTFSGGSAIIEFVNSSIRNTYQYGSNAKYTRIVSIDTVPTINEINTLRVIVFKTNGVVDLTKIRKSPISALFSNITECVASYNSSTQVNLEPKDDLYMKLKVDGTTIKTNSNGELEAIAPANMMKLAKITQADYDALETKDENTMYIVTGDSTVSIYIGSISIQ